MNNNKPDYIINLSIVGNTNVGKTSIINRFVNNNFSITSQTKFHTTYSKNIVIDGKLYQVNLTEISNIEILTHNLIKEIYDCHGIIIICDVSNIKSFDSISQWINLFDSLYLTENLPSFMVLGNKIDKIGTDLNFDITYITQFINEIKKKYMYQDVSAKLDLNINKAFEIFIRNIKNNKLDLLDIPLSQSLLDDDTKTNSCCSCCSIM
jgi:small GTP-binding protein